MDNKGDAAQIADEFPGWEAWQGLNRLWHARIRGAVPPVMVHGDNVADLREQILYYAKRVPADGADG